MKIAFYILCLVALSTLNYAQPQIHSREVLRNEYGKTGRLLADAMDQGSLAEIHKYAVALIESGKSKVIIGSLTDPSDIVQQGLSKALADTQQQQAVPDLVKLYDRMSIAVRGGTEAQLMRKATTQSVEQALVKLTGVSLEPNWTHSEKLAAFRKKVARNPQPPKIRDPRRPNTPNANAEAETKREKNNAQHGTKVSSDLQNKWPIMLAVVFVLGIVFVWLRAKSRA